MSAPEQTRRETVAEIEDRVSTNLFEHLCWDLDGKRISGDRQIHVLGDEEAPDYDPTVYPIPVKVGDELFELDVTVHVARPMSAERLAELREAARRSASGQGGES
jgi:hypothetical protein